MPYKNPEDRPSYAKYEQKPEIIKKRAARNKARAMLMKEGLVHKGDGKDVDHKQMLDGNGTNSKSNLRVVDKETNRGWRGKNGSAYGK
jgi:hypothetical protein